MAVTKISELVESKRELFPVDLPMAVEAQYPRDIRDIKYTTVGYVISKVTDNILIDELVKRGYTISK